MELRKLFYTPLFVGNIHIDNELLHDSIARTQFKHRDYISDDRNVIHTTFNFLLDGVNDFSDQVMKSMKYDEFAIFSSWLTRTTNYNLQAIDHRHSNSFMSGVVYLHQNCSPLLLRHPVPWRWSSGECTETTANDYVFEPECGSIIMFPSHIGHLITPLNHHGVRYTVAFNVIPSGTFGEGDGKITLSVTN